MNWRPQTHLQLNIAGKKKTFAHLYLISGAKYLTTKWKGFRLFWVYPWSSQNNKRESSRMTDTPMSSSGILLSVWLWIAALLPQDRLLAWQVAASYSHRSCQYNCCRCHSEALRAWPCISRCVCVCLKMCVHECVGLKHPAAGSSRWVRSVITELSGRRRVFGRSGWRWRNLPDRTLGNYQQ